MVDVDAQREREERARAWALRLLEISAMYDDVVVPAGSPQREWPVVVAMIARQRRLLRALVELADADLFTESQIIARTMLEFRIRLEWLLLDAPLNLLLWVRKEIDSRFTIDRETREWAREHGSNAEILRSQTRERLERERAEGEKLIAGIAAERGPGFKAHYPSLKQQAEKVTR